MYQYNYITIIINDMKGFANYDLFKTTKAGTCNQTSLYQTDLKFLVQRFHYVTNCASCIVSDSLWQVKVHKFTLLKPLYLTLAYHWDLSNNCK